MEHFSYLVIDLLSCTCFALLYTSCKIIITCHIVIISSKYLVVLVHNIMIMNIIPYTRKFSRYEIFAEHEANRIFAIIFSRITGSSWKGSMLCTVTNLQLLQTSKFSRIKFSLYQ